MIVSVIGLGYIGLPTAALISSKGIKVIGVDKNKEIVKSIKEGKANAQEPGLQKIVQNSLEKKSLTVVSNPLAADVFMIAVPTPFGENNKPDLSYVKSAVKSIALVLKKGNIVILESTCPVGTTEKIIEWMREERVDISFPKYGNYGNQADIAIAYCPERVIPGNVLNELVENDRLIGGVTSVCSNRALKVYKFFVEAKCLLTDCRTAELAKLVENSFRDVNIAFANELSLVADKLQINVWELIKLANHHPRVNILQPGPGVGGHCIAVDPWFIIDSAPEESKLIHAARQVNDFKPNFVLEKINLAISKIEKNKDKIKIACLGLSFKPDINDLRESPALSITQKITSMGFFEVMVVEPNIQKLPPGLEKNSVGFFSLIDAIKYSDIIVLLVDHSEFKNIDLDLLSGKQIIDTRGIWS